MTAYLLVGVVTVVAGVVEAIEAALHARTVRALERQHAREREHLLNVMSNLAGKPWLPAPADTWQPEDDEARRQYVTSPEQLP